MEPRSGGVRSQGQRGATRSAPACTPPATQRGIGSAAAAALLRIGQARLEVGASGDRYEREAEAVARRVADGMDRPWLAAPMSDGRRGAVTRISRLMRPGEGAIGADGGPLSTQAEAAIESARAGAGRPIEPGLRSRFESEFGTDFGGVRLHTGDGAATLNEGLRATAFTVGNDIFLGARAPDLASRGGRQLLAHELTHTIQQAGGTEQRVQRNGGGGTTTTPMTLQQAEEKLERARKRLADKKRIVKGKRRPTHGDQQSLEALEQNVKDAEQQRDGILNAPKTSSWLDISSWWGGSRVGGQTKDDWTVQDKPDPTTGKNTSWAGTNNWEKNWTEKPPETGLVTQEQGQKMQKEDAEKKANELVNKILDIPLIEITVAPEEETTSYLGGWFQSKSSRQSQLSVNRQGVKGTGKVEMSFGSGGKIEGGMGPAYVVGKYVNSNTSLEGFVGVKGGGEFQVGTTWEDLGMEGKLGAFAGAESSLKTEVVWKIGDKEAGRFKGGLGVTFGLGGEVSGTLKWPWGGDLEIKSNLKFATGLGFAYEIDWKIPTATWASWFYGGAKSLLSYIW